MESKKVEIGEHRGFNAEKGRGEIKTKFHCEDPAFRKPDPGKGR